MDRENKSKAYDEVDRIEELADETVKDDAESKLALSNKDEAEIEEQEERNEEADMRVQADAISRTGSEVDVIGRIFKVKFGRTYKFGGEEYDSLDLSGLDDISAVQLSQVDRIAEKLDVKMDDKINDTLWCKYIAIEATGFPLEFFNQMKVRDTMEMNAVIRYFFAFG